MTGPVEPVRPGPAASNRPQSVAAPHDWLGEAFPAVALTALVLI